MQLKKRLSENIIKDFYGVYYGQAALPMEPDNIVYLTSAVTDEARVWSLEENTQSGKNAGKVVLPDEEGAVWKAVYQTEKLEDGKSLDKYDMFVGGASSLQIIRSPKAATETKSFFNSSATTSVKAFNAFSASFLDNPAWSAIAAINSVLFILNSSC